MRIALLALVAFVVLQCTATMAQERTWSLNGLYGDIVASDCADCGDDVGLTMSCQGVGSNALVRVPWAAAPTYPGNSLPLVARVDGEEYTFTATFEEQGLVGFVPVFELPANHPLIDALARGREIEITVGQLVTYIGLRGSRQATEIFRAHCGWTQMPAYAGDLMIEAEPPVLVAADNAAEDQARWFIQQSASQDGTETVSLGFGIPQTDAVLLSTRCDTSQVNGSAELSLSIDFGVLQAGDAAQVDFDTYSGQFSYPGQVYIDSEESAGVRLTIGARAPLWRALASAKGVTFGVSGGPTATITAPDTDGVVKSFVESCFSGASTPSVKAEVPVVPVSPTPLAPAPATPVAPPVIAPAAPPVTADVGGGSASVFNCPDSIEVRLTLTGTAPKRVAVVVVGTNQPEQLNEMPAGANALFASANTTLFLKADALQIVQKGVKSDCQAASASIPPVPAQPAAPDVASNGGGDADRVFVCPNDVEVRLTVTGTAPKRVARLVVGTSEPEQMNEVPAGANALFASASTTLFVKDAAIQLVQKGVKSDCDED